MSMMNHIESDGMPSIHDNGKTFVLGFNDKSDAGKWVSVKVTKEEAETLIADLREVIAGRDA